MLFTPQKKVLAPLQAQSEKVYVVTLRLENFFDNFDFSYLATLLSQETNAIGLISEYDCPVVVKIYFPEEITGQEELISILESETLSYENQLGPQTVDLGL